MFGLSSICFCLIPIVRQFSFIFIVLQMSMFVWWRRTKYAKLSPMLCSCGKQNNLNLGLYLFSK